MITKRASKRRLERVRRDGWVVPFCVIFVIYVHVMWFTYLWALMVERWPSDFSEFKSWALAQAVGSLSLVDLLTWMTVAALLLFALRVWSSRKDRDVRRTFVALGFGAFVLGCYLYAVVLHRSGASWYDNDRVRSDAELIAQFEKRATTYEEHRARIASTLAESTKQLRFWDIYPGDWRWYMKRARVLCSDGGAHRATQLDGRDRVYYIATRNGIGRNSLTQGFAWLRSKPAQLQAALDAKPPATEPFLEFRHLRDNWYLFRSRGL